MNDPRSNNMGYFSHAPAMEHPGDVALIDLFGDQERTVTYATLEERLDRVAAAAVEAGLKVGARVAMCVGNRFEFVDAMYGLMRAGLVPVPLNTKLGADTISYILADSDCVAAIVEPSSNPFIVEAVEAAGIGVTWAMDDAPAGWQDYEAVLAAAPASFDPPIIADDHVAFQPYTSGSTGRPKGVILTHDGQLWWTRCLNRYWPPTRNARALAAMPLYHKNAMAGAIKPLLNVGGSVVILPSFEPVRFLTALSEYKCTRSGGVPAAFSMMLRHTDLIKSLDFSALQTLVIGSAPVAKELADAIEDAFGVTVGESYGLTEGGPVMLGPPLDGRPVPHGSCGVAWPEGEVKLVDDEGNEADVGELWVKNPGVTPGYHQLPDVNAKRIVDGWLRTGDLFHRDADGFYYFRGRTDDMFNSGGENIYPKEVEDLLLSHPAVVDACVVPVPHAVKGEVPVALVMLKGEGASDEEALKAFSIANGPAYAHPRKIMIVDQIPLNGAGKNDRTVVARELRERFGTLGAA
ncbi:MAG: class I adenylate-forming enzyme family protein [Devosia sp.]